MVFHTFRPPPKSDQIVIAFPYTMAEKELMLRIEMMASRPFG